MSLKIQRSLAYSRINLNILECKFGNVYRALKKSQIGINLNILECKFHS